MESARRHRIARLALPCAVAVVQLLGMSAMAHWRGIPVPPLAYVLLLASAGFLFFMFRSPALVLGIETVLAAAYGVAAFPPGPAFLAFVVSLVHAAFRGRRWQAWAVVGFVVLAAVLGELGWLPSGQGAPPLAAPAWLAVAVLLGEAARRRRQRISEVREQRLARIQAEQDEYRLTLARDIHDVVAHSLSMINVQASVALHLGTNEPERLRPALEAIKAASKESLAEVRQLLGVLREDAPLGPALRPGLARIPELVEQARLGGLQVALEDTAAPGEAGEAQQEAAYRVVQEALSNVRRHSGAASAVVRLAIAGEALEVRVDDDGAGLRGAEPGNGLTGMRERLEALGGTLALLPREPGQPNPGLRVEARIPLGERAEP
jgi:signal transduction histidine kinase